ncbi:MAG: ChaN family lipoprotein [Proteobacteria bacterium]|nr:ChaN family lipoprotein [Pseudomonadota bacterium]
MAILNRQNLTGSTRPTLSAHTLQRGGLFMKSFLALILSLFILSGCTSTKIVRLGEPVELRSNTLEEVEAALTDTAPDSDAGASLGSETSSVPAITPKIGKLNKKLAKLKAKHAVISKKGNDILASQNELTAEYDKFRQDIYTLENEANALGGDVIPGDELTDEIKAIVKKAKGMTVRMKIIEKGLAKLRPKGMKARYMINKSQEKVDRARKAVEEAMSDHEKKLSREFSKTMEEVLVEDIVAESVDADFILLGEVHSNTAHHRFQLEVIKALVESGREVAIGMEMFMVDAQDDLDSWVEGELDVEDLRVLYYEHWKTPWVQYAPILEYAKEAKIDLVALSIERSAVKRIFVKPESAEDDALEGSAVLAPEASSDDGKEQEEWKGGKLTAEMKAEIEAEVAAEMAEAVKIEEDEDEVLSIIMTREEMEAVTCEVEPEYTQMIKDAIGEHADDMNFDLDRFCRIQVVWDTAMALSAKQYIEKNSETTLVLIAGGMHAWKYGIPKQLSRLGAESVELLAEARANSREAKSVAKAAKAALKEAEEASSKAQSLSARALSFARQFTVPGRELFMGVEESDSGEPGPSGTEVEPVDLEAKADAEAAAAVAKKSAKEAEARFEELEAEYKEARAISREASKELKVLKRSKSEFKYSVVIPEMPEYEKFRSGGASTKDADYLILH